MYSFDVSITVLLIVGLLRSAVSRACTSKYTPVPRLIQTHLYVSTEGQASGYNHGRSADVSELLYSHSLVIIDVKPV